MTRLPDWQQRLSDWLASVSRQAFEPGVHDCALFAAGGVLAVTAIDLGETFRGQYRSEKAGRALLREAGFDGPEALAAFWLPEWPDVRMARAGDVAVVGTERGPALGLFQGRAIYTPGLTGLMLLPRGEALRAFRVG